MSPSLREKVADRCSRLGSDQPPGQGLGLGDDFVDRSDADLATGEFHDDVTAVIQADRLAKLCRNAETTRFGNASSYGVDALFSARARC